MSERTKNYLRFGILTICFLLVGYLEQQDVELTQQMAAEHQPVRMAKK
jgi:hypothetical protein